MGQRPGGLGTVSLQTHVWNKIVTWAFQKRRADGMLPATATGQPHPPSPLSSLLSAPCARLRGPPSSFPTPFGGHRSMPTLVAVRVQGAPSGGLAGSSWS